MKTLKDIKDIASQNLINTFEQGSLLPFTQDYSINVIAECYKKVQNNIDYIIAFKLYTYNYLLATDVIHISLDKQYDKFYQIIFQDNYFKKLDLIKQVIYIILLYNFIDIKQYINELEKQVLNNKLEEQDLKILINQLEHLSEVAVDYKERIKSWIMLISIKRGV